MLRRLGRRSVVLLAAGTAGVLWAAAGPAGAAPIATPFSATGAVQTFSVPGTICAVMIAATGAAGGGNGPSVTGGNGATVTVHAAVSPGSTLTVVVGGRGGIGSASSGVGAGRLRWWWRRWWSRRWRRRR